MLINWGDGNTSSFSASSSPGSLGSLSHTYANSGNFTVTESVTDSTNLTGSTSFTASVVATTPTVFSPGTQSASEGSSQSFCAGVVERSRRRPVDVLINWGDGNTSSFSASSPGSLGSLSHTYVDNGNFSVIETVTDSTNRSGSTSFLASVANVSAPSATGLSGPTTLNEGQSGTYSLTGVSDPSSVDAASLRYSFALSPAGLATSYATAGTSNSFTPNFADNGSYTVYGKVFDKDGGATTVTLNVTVNNVDPSNLVTSLMPPASTRTTALRLPAASRTLARRIRIPSSSTGATARPRRRSAWRPAC